MTAVGGPLEAPVSLAGAWANAVLAWRGITRAQLIGTFLLGTAYFLYARLSLLHFMLHTTFSYRPLLLTLFFVQEQVAAFVLLACIVVTERLTGRATRAVAYLYAVLVSAAVAGPLALPAWVMAFRLGAPETAGAQVPVWRMAPVWAVFFQWLLLAGGVTFMYADARRARSARVRLHAAELDRAQAARRTLESRLQAMQARVEPRFLFNTLAQVHELYGVSAARGETMLDQLIAYLRAAMPRMRDTSSTLSQEIDLVRAYLGIVAVRMGGFRYSLEPPETSIAHARVPPMMLLPLVDDALAHASSDCMPVRELTCRARAIGSVLRIEIAGSGMRHRRDGEEETLAGVRERLAALYGSLARLDLVADPLGGSTATLDLPLEVPSS